MLIAIVVFGPFIGAAAAAAIGKWNEKAGEYAALFLTAAVLGLTLVLARTAGSGTLYPEAGVFFPGEGTAAEVSAAGQFLVIPGILSGSGLTLCVTGFRAVYAVITAIMWVGTTMFSPEYFAHEKENLGRYKFFVLFTLGAVEGVMLSADLMTAFVFFEVLSFTSFTWVIHEETPAAIRAGYTYLFVAVIGGLLLFMGLVLLQHTAGTLSFEELSAALRGNGASADSLAQPQVLAAGILILLGFGAKAGMFPLHIWLPKAHPAAPSPASALLSGILTKVGVYGILMTALYVLAGDYRFGLIVLAAGLITMLLGAVLALFSVNLKRTLACSSMSQIGFILTGIAVTVLMGAVGEEEAVMTALTGTVQHMINHSLLKLTLFMCAGVVVMNLHKLTLDDIRGWGRNKLPLKIAFALGGLGISGVPLFNGYISKTLLHEGIVEAIHVMKEVQHSGLSTIDAVTAGNIANLLQAGEWIFLFSGGLTFAYMLKLFICVFVEKNRYEDVQERFDSSRRCMNPISTAAIVGSSLFMVILGMPPVTKRLLSFATGSSHIMEFAAFTPENLKGSAISLAIGAAVYLGVVRRLLYKEDSYINRWPDRLDLEEGLYRPALTKWIPGVLIAAASVFGENKVLTPVCRYCLEGVEKIAAVFGEDKILEPVCRFGLKLLERVSYLVSISTDCLILSLRNSVLHERKVRRAGVGRMSRMRMLREGTAEAVRPIIRNFTFALLMTCLGILVILGVLLIAIVQITP